VPERQSVPVLPLKGVVRDAVEARGVRFLVFRAKEYKDLLDRSPEVARVQDFGPWSIYEVK
jgi:hypothetical protein